MTGPEFTPSPATLWLGSGPGCPPLRKLSHERCCFSSGGGRWNWVPAVIAIAVTAPCGVLTLAIAASAGLTDSGPHPQMGWLTAGFYMQSGLGFCAVVLLIASRISARGQYPVARLGWVVIALSVVSQAIVVPLGRPA